MVVSSLLQTRSKKNKRTEAMLIAEQVCSVLRARQGLVGAASMRWVAPDIQAVLLIPNIGKFMGRY